MKGANIKQEHSIKIQDRCCIMFNSTYMIKQHHYVPPMPHKSQFPKAHKKLAYCKLSLRPNKVIVHLSKACCSHILWEYLAGIAILIFMVQKCGHVTTVIAVLTCCRQDSLFQTDNTDTPTCRYTITNHGNN